MAELLGVRLDLKAMKEKAGQPNSVCEEKMEAAEQEAAHAAAPAGAAAKSSRPVRTGLWDGPSSADTRSKHPLAIKGAGDAQLLHLNHDLNETNCKVRAERTMCGGAVRARGAVAGRRCRGCMASCSGNLPIGRQVQPRCQSKKNFESHRKSPILQLPELGQVPVKVRLGWHIEDLHDPEQDPSPHRRSLDLLKLICRW